MRFNIVGLLAETFVHPGSAQTGGAIDLPVAREAATDYPYIAGSSLKGALRDQFEQRETTEELFGKPDSAGHILVADARLLLLPVRSLTGAYKWATCPHLLERYTRDRHRCGTNTDLPSLETLERKQFLGAGKAEQKLYLEERSFRWAGALSEDVIQPIAELIAYEPTKARLADQLVILHDDDFTWFARYGLAVQARNKLNDNKTSDNLWYEESIPPDTLMYAVLAGREPDPLREVCDWLSTHAYLQTGGNETVGQGWFAVNVLNAEASEASHG